MSTKPFVDPMIGKTVAQYEIVAKLGGGGMGIVYQAKDARLGRLVALKFLPPQWSHDENAKQRFIREAQAASATDHAHICTIHDIESTDDGQLFIVMAYYNGQTLKQKLEAGRAEWAGGAGGAGQAGQAGDAGTEPQDGSGEIEVEEALRIASQIAEGLMKAHAQGVVHRDIKPGNLMLTEDGVKILDFGLAKFADSLQLTIAGSTLGTVAYMSPEQARGEDADARSDIWALGVVLYEMLTGELPFKGAYPEAISHAIRNEAPAPIAVRKPGITPQIETVVFRALEKDPARRYQTAREMARDLRLLQGFTIPIDLRGETLTPAGSRSRRRSRGRAALVAAAVVLVAAAGVYAWLARPIARVPVAVGAVVNQTGYPELDPYRLALTETLVDGLSESPSLRVLPYERWLQIVRRFLTRDSDASSRESLQALGRGARFVVVPTILYENNAWRARAEIRNVDTSTNAAVYETEPVVSSLSKDTALALMASLAGGIERHFMSAGPLRLRVKERIRSIVGRRLAAGSSPLRSLDAAAAFEQGLNAYEQLEYAAARNAFARAGELDPSSSLPFAWRSRVAVLMRQDQDAVTAGDQALKLITPQTREADRLFVQAVSAEARRETASAEARYRGLVALHPDEPIWVGELAAFQDRRAQTPEAIASYHRALGLDAGLSRPHLELCRLYNRVNESARAKEQGQAALASYRAIGNRGGEAQALMCLADCLRLGTAEERAEAGRDAQQALKILDEIGYAFNTARAQYYVGLTKAAAGDLAAAAALWEQSLAHSREVGNRTLESLDLLNLGGSNTLLGKQMHAIEFYRQGQALSESLGDERRAAEQRANAAAILIEYSDKPAEGFRDIQNALGVFRQLGDHTFEVFAEKLIGEFYWYGGRHADAERELNRGVALTKQWNLDDRVAPLTLEIARSRFDVGDYSAALEFAKASGGGSRAGDIDARIHVARTHVRMGGLDEARAELAQALEDVTAHPNAALLPALHLALGELALDGGNRADARLHFQQAAGFWSDDLPDIASVEARSHLGVLDALEGRRAAGERAIRASLDRAARMGRFSLEARCRLQLARIYVGQRAFEQATEVLKTVGADGPQSLGPEVQAQVHYWRSRALAGRGQAAAASTERDTARTLAGEARASLAGQYRERFTARPDIGLLLQ